MFHQVPVIEADHEDAFITEKMYVLIRSGNFTKVPLLMGINSEESLYDAADLNSLEARAAYYDSHLEDLVPEDMGVSEDNTKKQLGTIIRQIYVADGVFANNISAVVRVKKALLSIFKFEANVYKDTQKMKSI